MFTHGKSSFYIKMATPALTVTDLLYLYKPGQLSDMVSMLRKALMLVTSATVSTAAQGDIRVLGTDITAVVTKASVPGVINTSGPNAAQINTILARYKTIPTTLSGYIQPPPGPQGQQELAKDNALLGPIITYVDTVLDDFCTKLIFLIIKDNDTTTDATKIDNIKNMILSFLTFINDVPSKIKIPGTLINQNFPEISTRLSDILSAKLGVIITPPNSISLDDFLILCSQWPWPQSEVMSRPLATASLIFELARSVKLPLADIAAANKFDAYNTPKNIDLIKSIPSLLQILSKTSADPDAVIYIENQSAGIYPIAEPTNTLFIKLNKANFSASLSQPSTGIMAYIINKIIMDIFYNKANKQASDLVGRAIHRSFSTPQLLAKTIAKIVPMFKGHVKIVNTIIDIFKVKLTNDPVSLRLATIFNNSMSKGGFKINIVPTASGGKRSKRSRKLRQKRRRTVKNLTPK